MHLEKEIIVTFSNWMKSRTGRGPREIKVTIEEDYLQIIFTNFLSILEENYLKFKGDPKILNEIRSYLLKEDNIVWEKIEELIYKPVKKIKVEMKVEENTGKILIEYGKMEGHGVKPKPEISH